MSAHDKGLTKNERRAQAREQARAARAAERAREKRNKALIRGGVAVVVLAIIAIVALVVSSSLRGDTAAGANPKNMASGGVVFTKDLKVAETPALQDGEDFKPTQYDPAKRPVHVQVYADFMCPACGNFENTYGPMLEQYVGSGDISLELYPLNFLDPQSAGTKYSSRAASSLDCVVTQQPDKAFAYQKELFANMPEEGTAGHTNAELLKFAEQAGVEQTGEFKKCVNENRYTAFVDRATNQVLSEEMLGLADGAQLLSNPGSGELQPKDEPQRLISTPTVIVNGKQWYQPRDGDLEQFILKLLQGLDASETEAGSNQ